MSHFHIPDDWVYHRDIVFAQDTIPFMWHRPKELLELLKVRNITGKGLKIGIVDTGYDVTHQYLPKPKAVANFTSSGGRDVVTDRQGHGSHVAGIICGLQGIGLLPEAEVYIAKGLGDDGSGSVTWLNNGLKWLADRGCHFINGSYGGPSGGQEDLNAIDYCYSKGVWLLHFAAGNSGYNGRTNTIGYPARHNRGSCNGSYDANGNRSSFGSGGIELQLLGAGGQVVSTVPGNKMAPMSGTSMGSPDVMAKTGAVAIARRMAGLPDIVGHKNWDEFYKELFAKKLIKDGHTEGRDTYWGYGQLMTEAIVDYIKDPLGV